MTAVPDLSALEIDDPQQAAEQYRARIVDPIKGLLPEEVVNSIREQLSGAWHDEIAAFDEFTGLLTDASLLARYDPVILIPRQRAIPYDFCSSPVPGAVLLKVIPMVPPVLARWLGWKNSVSSTLMR